MAEGIPSPLSHHIFQWDGGGSSVYLTGSFNDWKEYIPVKIPAGPGSVYVDLELAPGTYEYRFYVDGEWKHDPSSVLPTTDSGNNQVIISNAFQLDFNEVNYNDGDDNADSDDSDSDFESVCSEPSASGSLKGESTAKFFLNFSKVAKDHVKQHLIGLGFGNNIRQFKVHKKGSCATVAITPNSVGGDFMQKCNGTMILGQHKLRISPRKKEGKKANSKAKRQKVGSNVEAQQQQGPPAPPQAASVAGSIPKANRVFFGSKLPEYTNEQHVREHFQKFDSKIEKIELIRDRKTNVFKGFGFVTLKNSKCAHAAIKALDQSTLLGVKIKVSFDAKQQQQQQPQGQEPLAAQGQGAVPPLLPPPPASFSSQVPHDAASFKSNDSSDTESVSTSTCSEKNVKIIVHSRPKFPDYISGSAFRKHFADFEPNIANAFVVKDRKTKKSRGFGLVFVPTVELAERLIEAKRNTRVAGKYELISLSIEGQKGKTGANNPVIPPPPQPLFQQPLQQAPVFSEQDCVVIENLDSSFDESGVSSLLKFPMLSFTRRSPYAVVIKLYSPADASATASSLNGRVILGQTLRAYVSSSTSSVQQARPPGGGVPVFDRSYSYPQAPSHPPVLSPQLSTSFSEGHTRHYQSPQGGQCPPPQAQYPPPPPQGQFSQPSYQQPHPSQFPPPHPPSFPPGPQGQAPPPQLQGRLPPPPLSPPSQMQPPSPNKAHHLDTAQQAKSVKVTHFPHTATKETLYMHFRRAGEIDGDPVILTTAKTRYARINFYDPLAALRAVEMLNNSMLDGQKITVKLQAVKESPKKAVETANINRDDHSRELKLEPSQWNTLMLVGPSGSTLFKETMEPFNSNPNVIVKPNYEEQIIKFTGKLDAVEDAYSFLMRHLKKDIAMDRCKMEALVRLRPSLPGDMNRQYGVHVLDFKVGSTLISFSGPVAAMAKAHDEISTLLQHLQTREVQLENEYQEDQLQRAREQIKEPVYICASESSPKRAVTVYSFDTGVLERVTAVAKQLLSVSVHHLECKPEEVVYLKHFNKAFMSSLPAKVNYHSDKVILSGRDSETRSSAERIRKEVLAGLYSHKFTYSCSAKFHSQIEQSVLQPHNSEEPTFKYFSPTPKGGGGGGGGKGRGRRGSSHQQKAEDEVQEVIVYIFCKNQEFFEKMYQLLQKLNPSTRHFPVSHKGAAEIIEEMRGNLEDKYSVRIIQTKPSSVIIHGLNPDDIECCHNEIKQKVESTLLIMKYIPINTQLHNLLKLYPDELSELRRNCSELSLLPPNKDHESCAIVIKGSISQVNDVNTRLTNGLLAMKVSVERFELDCPPSLFGMWCRRWDEVKLQEGKKSKVSLSFSKSSDPSGQNKLIVAFELVGADEVGVQEVKAALTSEGVETEERTFGLSQLGANCLLKAKREKKLDFLKDVIAYVGNIDKQANTVTICAPKELSDNLDTAEDLIRKFVGDRANTSQIVSSSNPVVGLILSSNAMNYVATANALSRPHNVAVSVSKKPTVGLCLKGTESNIALVKPLIQTAIIKAIEATIGQKQIPIKSFYSPVLTTSEYTRFLSKLETDLCIVCSRPPTGKSSKLICSSKIHLASRGIDITVEICKGNLVLEQVDAIVNAANDELKHIGGLAKAVLDAGGESIQTESDDYIRTHKKVKPGYAVCLGAGDLPCKRVVHAVGPQWSGGRNNEEQTLYFAVFRSLTAASEASCTTVALPAIGTGVYSVPNEVCARASLKATRDFFMATSDTPIHTVKFVLFHREALDAFKASIKTSICGEYQQGGAAAKSLTEYKPVTFASPSSIKPVAVEAAPKRARPPTRAVDPIRVATASVVSPMMDWQPVGISSPPSSSGIEWQWYNDQGTFSYYSAQDSSRITSAYNHNSQAMFQMFIQGKSYTIDFVKMVQINDTTGYPRPIRKVTGSSNVDVSWSYRDKGRYLSYTSEESRAIEQMYQNQVPGQLVIKGNTYAFDFTQMCQMNISTLNKRPIQRNAGGSAPEGVLRARGEAEETEEEEKAKEAKDIVLTLQGPHENLATAETKLMGKLESFVKEQTIDDKLPKKMTPELEKKLLEIGRKNDIICSFEGKASKGTKVLKMKGIYFKLQAAVNEIQEEILNFHINSAPAEEIDIPPEWEPQSRTTELFQVRSGSPEWQKVQIRFDATMAGHQILSITRIQNKWIWEKYVTHKRRLEKKNNGTANEMELFHGTRNNDPKLIYEGEDGFDMRYGAQGMWGVANYFAVKASYSHNYAHATIGGKEMFLVKVLTGDSCNCPPDRSLRMPPPKSSGVQGEFQFAGMKYDTVTGNTGGSSVYMTYDNDKAYPAYLITYQ